MSATKLKTKAHVAVAGRSAAWPSGGPAYNYYIIIVFAVAYVISFTDRVLISLLIAPIKAEFSLSDTQIGVLIGFGFVLFYSVLGLPFGALADRSNRRNLILAGLIAWSAATSLSGLAGGFAMLVSMRALVGVGEASLSPSVYSTIADRFPPDRSGLAIAIYGAGGVLGIGLGMIFGGVLVEWAKTATINLPLAGVLGGWRLAFVVVGSLGVPLAVLIGFSVKEAPRVVRVASPPMSELWRYLTDRSRAMIGILAGLSFANVSNYTVYLWMPTLLMRVHGLDAQTTGLAFGALVIVFGTVGMLGSGILVDWLVRRGVADAPIQINIYSLTLQFLLIPAALLVNDVRIVLALMAPALILMTAANSVQAMALQLMTPPLMRGRMIAIYILGVAMVGMGISPLAIGLLTDHVFINARGLPWSMALVVATGTLLGIVTLATARSHARSVIQELAGGEMPRQRSGED